MNRLALSLVAVLLGGFLSDSAQISRAQPISGQLAHSPVAERPRNVIFILSDDHRYDFMSFMKNNVPWLQTPNLDKMRQQGAHCPNAFVTTALCSPSRGSILTGQYVHQHTIVDNVSPEPTNVTYFPQYLQKANYQTAFFGKWHMGDENANPRKGFDRWVSFAGQGVYYNPTLNIDGKAKTYTDSSYTPTVITDFALDWLTKRDKAKPFFMCLSHKSVHGPFMASKKDAGIYTNKQYTWPASNALTDPKLQGADMKTYKDVPKWVQHQRTSWHGVDYPYHTKIDINDYVRQYCETVHSLDTEIGRVMNYLEKNGLDQNTVVIYMSDNGFMFGEHGLIDKRVSYEESMRVPMVIRSPGMVRAGGTIDQMIQNTDIAPTILELAGLQAPAYMVGRSIVPLMQGKPVNDWRKRIFYEYFWEHDFPHTPTQFAVRTDRYKYIRYQGIWDINEFYDLQADPHEMNNLIRDPSHQETIKGLANDIYDWLESTGGMQIPLKRTVKTRMGDHENANTY